MVTIKRQSCKAVSLADFGGMSDLVLGALIAGTSAVLAASPSFIVGLMNHGKLGLLTIEVDGKMKDLIELVRSEAKMSGTLEEKDRDKSGDSAKRG
jgi:hypothetical protein